MSRGSAGSRITRAGPLATPPHTPMPWSVPANARAVRRAGAQLPRIGVRDAALEPERRHARLQEVALVGALGDHIDEAGRVAYELLELAGGDQVAVAAVGRTAARLGAGRQLVEHRPHRRRARGRTRPSPARVPRHRRWPPRVLDATPAGGAGPPSAMRPPSADSRSTARRSWARRGERSGGAWRSRSTAANAISGRVAHVGDANSYSSGPRWP